MHKSCTMASTEHPTLDPDLDNVLKEVHGLIQNLISTKKELKSAQLELKVSKAQLESMRQQIDANNRGANTEWNRFSKSLDNIIKVIGDRKDISDYERTIQNLTVENESMKQQIASAQSKNEEALEREKLSMKEKFDRETARLSKQISELMIDKELAASTASIQYDMLLSQLDRTKEQYEAQYEKLLQTLTEQKQKLREENFALKQREATLQDQLEQMQSRSTDFLLGRGQRVAPISSQRYTEVVETIPIVSSGCRKSVSISVEEPPASQRSSVEVAEVSSSSGRSMTNRAMLMGGSPQHPGSGGHVTKPRKKRKLFNLSAERC